MIFRDMLVNIPNSREGLRVLLRVLSVNVKTSIRFLLNSEKYDFKDLIRLLDLEGREKNRLLNN